jgi:hypothetical protein
MMVAGSSFYQIYDIETLANFSKILAKLVKFILEKHDFPNFPQFVLSKKKTKFVENKSLGVSMLKPLLHSKAKSKKKVENTLEKHFFPIFPNFL